MKRENLAKRGCGSGILCRSRGGAARMLVGRGARRAGGSWSEA